MTQSPVGNDKKLGVHSNHNQGRWVQTERKAHEAWANLIYRKPTAAMLLHHLVSKMGHQNAVVISQKTLSKILRVHIRTVARAINDLVSERWIQSIQFGGNGTVSAYVVNDRVAWGQPRNQLNLSTFSANVVADFDDQDFNETEHEVLRKIPVMYPGERQLPDDSHDDPQTQTIIPGIEPDLPSIEKTKELPEQTFNSKEAEKKMRNIGLGSRT
jgi:DNA-binding transcriptional regulator YhcF (GntR family)